MYIEFLSHIQKSHKSKHIRLRWEESYIVHIFLFSDLQTTFIKYANLAQLITHQSLIINGETPPLFPLERRGHV